MARKSVLARTPIRRGKARRGRPFVHHEGWSKVSVVLFNRQVVRLDDAVRAVRRKTGHALNRAAIIRAFIDGVLDSPFDLTAITSERELRQQIAQLLRR